MSNQPLLPTALTLAASAEALAALAAHLRLGTEHVDADPAISALLAEIAGELLGEQSSPPDDHAEAVIGMARSLLRQAIELIDHPGRRGGWELVDPSMLQGIGKLSMSIVDAFAVAADELDGLAQRLASGTGAILDVGTGTGWLAIACARRFPHVRVVGIDVFEPALELAAANVADAGLGERIELRRQDVLELGDDAAFDMVWLALPFLPEPVVLAAIERCRSALRPGGWLVGGVFASPDGRLARVLTDLRTVRSGGRPWRDHELIELFDGHGLEQAQAVRRRWDGPVELVAARRPVDDAR